MTAIVFLCCSGSGSGSSEDKDVLDKDSSYALGMLFGMDIRQNVMDGESIAPDLDEFIRGMRDGLSDGNMRFTMEQANDIVQIAFDAIMERRNDEAKQNEINFLAENARKPGVILTPSGLQYEIINEGSGPKPTEDNVVLVYVEEKLTNGSFLYSSHTRGFPDELDLSDMLPQGWIEGLQLMSLGGKYRFFIPSILGYGEDGFTDPWTNQVIIPPFAATILEVELLEINPRTGE